MHEFAYSKRLMGTDVSVSIVTHDETLAAKIADEAFVVIHTYEQRFSRFLPDSELSLLNKSRDMVVSEEFLAVLTKSYGLYQETAGGFNPLLQIYRLGYDTDFKEITEDTRSTSEIPYNIDFMQVTIDRQTRRVILQADQQLDFGGILKGHLATKLANELKERFPDCYGLIINIGGDLHTLGVDEFSRPFIFDIYNPVTKAGVSVPLINQSLATSGSYKRTWKNGSGKHHHILATDGLRNPDTDIVSASVTHKDGATAEAYATLLIVSGLDHAKTIIDTSRFGYLLIKSDGTTLTNIS